MEENNKNDKEVVIEEDLNSTIENVENKDEPKEKPIDKSNSFDKFGIAGFVLGIIGLVEILSKFMYLNSYDDYQVTRIVLGTLSIVFSTLGQKSVKCKKLAYIGLGLGITLLTLAALFITLKAIGINIFHPSY